MQDESMVSSKLETQSDEPLFLYISPARLIIMSIVSMGIYELYWIYKNWRYMKERYGMDITPFWRGFFGLFFCHSLLRKIHEDQESNSIQTPTFSPVLLATVWVILSIIAALLSNLIIYAFIPAFLCLVPVQIYINEVTSKRNPEQKYYGWSSGHVVCLVYGIFGWSVALAGLLMGL